MQRASEADFDRRAAYFDCVMALYPTPVLVDPAHRAFVRAVYANKRVFERLCARTRVYTLTRASLDWVSWRIAHRFPYSNGRSVLAISPTHLPIPHSSHYHPLSMKHADSDAMRRVLGYDLASCMSPTHGWPSVYVVAGPVARWDDFPGLQYADAERVTHVIRNASASRPSRNICVVHAAGLNFSHESVSRGEGVEAYDGQRRVCTLVLIYSPSHTHPLTLSLALL